VRKCGCARVRGLERGVGARSECCEGSGRTISSDASKTKSGDKSPWPHSVGVGEGNLDSGGRIEAFGQPGTSITDLEN